MSVLRAIGDTPLVRVEGVWVKLEHLNPSGSVKDRIAKYIVERAEREGLLRKGGTIVEATTGNTGIAFSLVAAVKGYKMVAVLPRGLSSERTKLIRGFGAELRFVEKDRVDKAVALAERLARANGWFMPRQFHTPWNPEEHRLGMGAEIAQAMGRVDCFVAGVGTGGTLIGCGKAIRKRWPRARLVAVEPAECALLAGAGYGGHRQRKAVCGHHGIEGIGDGFVPDIIQHHADLIDEVAAVRSRDAIAEARRLCAKGYLVGPSSGANFLVAKRMRKWGGVVTLFPDRAERYLSTGLLH